MEQRIEFNKVNPGVVKAMSGLNAYVKGNMKLVVLGATGGTGLELVRQAIEHGHSVTAFVRSPERLKPFRDRIKVKEGDLLNSAELERVIEGHDAVVSGFGPRVPVSKADANLLQQFAVALTSAMLHAGVTRVVVQSVAFLFKDSIIPPAYLLGRLFFPGIVADASVMEEVFEKSGLGWTIVRPPELTDKPYTGKYRIREGHLPPFGFRISRADVADFMIKVVEDRSSIGKIVGVCN
ncbi:MAG: SDR family oxidoreductase [Acidobacteria bacterium]|nr:SDR family oxidoreductase [Acidobacteriota bacterium]